ncbi:MAG: pilus assembly protein, partial [Burkholderiaceae bacterium]
MNVKPLFTKQTICISVALAFGSPAHAVLGLNQIPPDAITPPVPNLIVTLDDSGSMAAEVPYDPAITYQIPTDRSGTSLTNRVFPRAYTDGFNATGDFDVTTRPEYTTVTDTANFTNWFSFYRTRNLSMKAAVYLAFAPSVVPDGRIRLAWQGLNATCTNGFPATNNCPVGLGSRRNAISSYEGDHRTNFFNWVRSVPASSNTPLRAAYDRVGQYLQVTGTDSPYANTPGTASAAAVQSCRRSYHILFTDGQWNDNTGQWNPTPTPNQDNTAIAALPADVSGGAGPAYTLQRPYPGRTNGTEGQNSLADVAFRYWATDLQPSAQFKNDVIPSIKRQGSEDYKDGATTVATVGEFWNPKNNPAYWQHLQTFAVGFGEAADMSAAAAGVASSVAPTFGGTTTAGDSFAQLVAGTREWPTVNNFDLRQFDLWHAAVNSRGDVYPAQNLQSLVDAFKKILGEILAGNGPTGGAASSLSFSPGFLAVQAGYIGTPNWRGSLLGFGQTGGAINATADFDSQVAITAQPEDTRVVLTASAPTTAVPFRWTINGSTSMSVFQQEMLNKNPLSPTGASDGWGAYRVRYLRGSTANDTPVLGEPTFRDRQSAVLGTIVNSEPRFVGVPRSGFANASYKAFRDANASREKLVYVGANDGMLHAFNADATSSLKGQARLSYVPRGVFSRLSEYTDLSYTHKYFVDGPIFQGDISTVANPTSAADWKSVLIGGLGAGGKGLFALNVTNPANFSETNASSVVMFDYTAPADSLTTSASTAFTAESGAAGVMAEFSSNLGQIFGDPVRDPFVGRNLQIAQLADGRWALISGNGINSTQEKAALYVFYLDSAGGFRKIVPTNAAANGPNNGLSTPLPTDSDGDGRVDTVYAGDLKGNFWKFDLSNAVPSSWVVANGGAPLITTVGNRPITTAPIITSHPEGGSFL